MYTVSTDERNQPQKHEKNTLPIQDPSDVNEGVLSTKYEMTLRTLTTVTIPDIQSDTLRIDVTLGTDKGNDKTRGYEPIQSLKL